MKRGIRSTARITRVREIRLIQSLLYQGTHTAASYKFFQYMSRPEDCRSCAINRADSPGAEQTRQIDTRPRRATNIKLAFIFGFSVWS